MKNSLNKQVRKKRHGSCRTKGKKMKVNSFVGVSLLEGDSMQDFVKQLQCSI